MGHFKFIFLVMQIISLTGPSSGFPAGKKIQQENNNNNVVSDLLTSLFRQTIYNRIENLLLDPGKKSTEKQKIIESAVNNYHRQKMILPVSSASATSSLEATEALESSSTTRFVDISELTGKL